MTKLISTAAAGLAFLALAAPALASEAKDKCMNFVTSQDIPDGESGCTCFADAVEADAGLLEEYLTVDLTDWENAASDGLKAAASVCFPNA